jgi:phenylpropionate dioxygenase-like ring-hydroxylating dioxygenase large terminal subunit
MTRESYSGARSPGITYQQLLDTDTHAVPDVLRLESPKYMGSADVDKAHYISREWHDREVEHLWSRVWQFACREDDIPNVGDHVIYEIVRDSFIVIRTAADEIKAYPNACLHRGRRLKDHEGNCSEIRCPFHGFSWTLDGALQDVPARWDFEHVNDEDFSLPECEVGTWAGFVMINPDPDAEPLADYLGDIGNHFDRWDLSQRYTQAHVAKVIQANWKIAQEAFCESFHVNATHPQILPYLGDTNTQVDVWDNFSRAISPGGTPSPLLEYVPTQDEMMRAMTDTRVDEPTPIPVNEDASMRTVGAASSRERWRATAGDAVDNMSDAEMMDNIDYTVFPNFHPWGSFNRIVYRFRPNGDDHRSSLMECIFLGPYSGEKPANAPIHFLEEDETFTDAPELGTLGKVFNQDLFNMARVQRGLETSRKPGVTLGNYQESKVRWIHTKLDEWCGDDRHGDEQ